MSVVLLSAYEASLGEEWLSPLPTGCAVGPVTCPRLCGQSSPVQLKAEWKACLVFFFKCWDSSSPDRAWSSWGNPALLLQGQGGRCPQLDRPAVTDSPVPAPPRVAPEAGSGRKGSSRSGAPSPAHPAGAPRERGRRLSPPTAAAGPGAGSARPAASAAQWVSQVCHSAHSFSLRGPHVQSLHYISLSFPSSTHSAADFSPHRRDGTAEETAERWKIFESVLSPPNLRRAFKEKQERVSRSSLSPHTQARDCHSRPPRSPAGADRRAGATVPTRQNMHMCLLWGWWPGTAARLSRHRVRKLRGATGSLRGNTSSKGPTSIFGLTLELLEVVILGEWTPDAFLCWQPKLDSLI